MGAHGWDRAGGTWMVELQSRSGGVPQARDPGAVNSKQANKRQRAKRKGKAGVWAGWAVYEALGFIPDATWEDQTGTKGAPRLWGSAVLSPSVTSYKVHR